MQSFLQYRRIGRQVRRQLDRKNGSALNVAVSRDSARAENSLQPTQINREAEGVEGVDPEKASPKSRDDSGEDEEEEEEEEEREEAEPLPAADADQLSESRLEATGSVLSRVSSSKSHRSLGTRLGRALTGVNVRNRVEAEGGDLTRQIFVVGFEGDDDPNHPQNWSKLTRLGAMCTLAGIGAIVGFSSAIDSAVIQKAAADFQVSEVTESLATGLFLVGFGVGSLFAGPISETIGRTPVYVATLSMFMIWVMAAALAPNIGAQLAFRFLAGFFGSTPLTCAGGSIADMWNPLDRVYTFPIFANAAFTGPLLGPALAGFIADPSSRLGWRWTEWLTLIISGAVLTLVVLFQPETYAPILLKWKAEHLRRMTGDDRYVAPIEIRAQRFRERLAIALYRPFVLTAREPIVIFISLYLTVVYIILFTFLDGYDYIYGEIHGVRPSIQGLCFFGIIAGLFFASCLVPLIYKWAKRDLQRIKEQGGSQLPPEFRLWFAMLGGALAIPISLFWMGWTSDGNISIWSPILASVLFGFGILCVFISSYQYIIDSYEIYAASALASVTLLRYVASGGMVVVGIPFYSNLGVHYTLTILGCLSAALVPLPYVFFKYGPRIRKRSKYAVDKFTGIEESKKENP